MSAASGPVGRGAQGVEPEHGDAGEHADALVLLLSVASLRPKSQSAVAIVLSHAVQLFEGNAISTCTFPSRL